MENNIEIVEIERRKHWRSFFKFPKQLYKGNPFYVRPTKKAERRLFSWKNPRYNDFILKAFLAIKNEKEIVGRLAVIIKGQGLENRSQTENIMEKKIEATFTRFDFVDDFKVSLGLMEKVITLVKRTGVSTLYGPVGFGEADEKGVLVEGFDRNGKKRSHFKELFGIGESEIYNYAYYQEHIGKLGFEKKEDLVCDESGKIWRIFQMTNKG